MPSFALTALSEISHLDEQVRSLPIGYRRMEFHLERVSQSKILNLLISSFDDR